MPSRFQSHRRKWDSSLYSKSNIRESYLIRIVVEGARTETRFFRNCIRTSTRIRVEVLSPEENRSGPEQLLNQIQDEIRRDGEQDNRQPADQNWIVCDVDDHAHLEDVIKVIDPSGAENPDTSPGIQIAISNPCFEVWLALYKKRDLNSRIIKTKLCDKKFLKAMISEIDPHFSKLKYNTQLFKKHAMAIMQAKILDVHKQECIPSSPGTRVYRLIEEILKVEDQQSKK